MTSLSFTRERKPSKSKMPTLSFIEKIWYLAIIKEIKNAPECIVELYKHAGIFKNTREVHREARGVAECFSHFSSVLKNSQVLI